MGSFEDELGAVINRYSQEQASNTPDFILAQYLIGCLAAWNTAVQQRETWYGRDARPCHIAMKEAAFDGDYVLYTDHLAAIAEKDREIERLSDLLWGARCVFCGEVIGKEKKNQDIADEVLRQHIKSCPKHPLTIARARIKELEHNLEVVKQTKRRER